jgi:hypothetical protein
MLAITTVVAGVLQSSSAVHSGDAASDKQSSMRSALAGKKTYNAGGDNTPLVT